MESYKKLWINGLAPKTFWQFISIGILIVITMSLIEIEKSYFIIFVFGTFFIGYSYSAYKDFKDQAYKANEDLKNVKK